MNALQRVRQQLKLSQNAYGVMVCHVETILVQIFITIGICSTQFVMNLNIYSYFKDYFLSLDVMHLVTRFGRTIFRVLYARHPWFSL